MKLVDVHAHLQFPQFDADREEVIKRTREAGIGVINVGTGRETSGSAVKLADKYEKLWATVGLHPTDWSEGLAFDFYKKLAEHPKVVAIGECGLDSVKLKTKSEKEKQEEIFVRQIELANELKKPLMLHIRQAYRDAYEILKNHAQVRGNVHFFSGDWLTAKKFLDLGFTLSFSGVITFVHDYDEVIKNIPLDMLLCETDCPFAAPRPWRGQRNEPKYVFEIVRRLAKILKLTEEEVAAAALANTHRVFNLQ